MGDPALLAEPVVGPAGQVVDGVLREELRCHRAQGRFFGDRFRAVLAELGGLAVTGGVSGHAQPGQSNPWR